MSFTLWIEILKWINFSTIFKFIEMNLHCMCGIIWVHLYWGLNPNGRHPFVTFCFFCRKITAMLRVLTQYKTSFSNNHEHRNALWLSSLISWLKRRSYLEELDIETEEPEGRWRRRSRGGEPGPGRLLGDLDRRQGSFHSSGRLMTGRSSFFKGGSIGLLRRFN